jgi:hypothetical protein
MPIGTRLVMMEETSFIVDQTELVTEGDRLIYIETPDIEATEKVDGGFCIRPSVSRRSLNCRDALQSWYIIVCPKSVCFVMNEPPGQEADIFDVAECALPVPKVHLLFTFRSYINQARAL